MKLAYDPNYNMAYIALREKNAPVETLYITDDVHIDIGADGLLYGIELLNADRQLRRGGGFGVQLVNESSGETQDIALKW